MRADAFDSIKDFDKNEALRKQAGSENLGKYKQEFEIKNIVQLTGMNKNEIWFEDDAIILRFLLAEQTMGNYEYKFQELLMEKNK